MKVQVLVPAHAGLLPSTPALTVNVRLQLSVTIGAFGTVARSTQATVELPGLGIVTTGGAMV